MRCKEISYVGWPHCLYLDNGTIELIITLDVGPRIIRFGYIGGQNMFKEFPEQVGKTSGDEWLSFGGHRLWHAPEKFPRTYTPDFDTVSYTCMENSVLLTQKTESSSGIQKQIEISMDEHVHIRHILTNKNVWPITYSAWAVTVMAEGGRAVIPQEPFMPHSSERLAPVRPLVLWPYTQMQDSRFTWGNNLIQIREDTHGKGKQKIGVLNKQSWAVYTKGEDAFVLISAYQPNADYPDMGCNFEFYTESGFLEMETLSPLKCVQPNEKIIHDEKWSMLSVGSLPEDDIECVREIQKHIVPLVGKILKNTD